MAEIVKPYKIGNYWTNLVDSSTGESVNFEEVSEWVDGTSMDDTKADGVIYRKLPASVGGGYVKRVIPNGVFNVIWFGAVGDGITDDTEAIQNAIDVTHSIGKVGTLSTNAEILFPTNHIYSTTDTIEVPEGVDVNMAGRVRYDGAKDRPAFVIGRSGIPNRGARFNINLNTPRNSDWSVPEFDGVRFVNSNQCEINIELVDGFYKGVNCVGDNQGFAYNQVNIQILNSNKYGVYLDYVGSGWCNENIFYGGRFSTVSGFNSGETRVGVRVTGDDNRFYSPSFELDRSTSTPGFSHAAVFDDAISCKIIHCRNEGNSANNFGNGGYAFVMNGGTRNCLIEVGYVFNRQRGREMNAFQDNSFSKQNRYVHVENLWADGVIGDVVYSSGDLAAKFISTNQNTGSIPGLVFVHRSGAISNYTASDVTARVVGRGQGFDSRAGAVELHRTAFAVNINTSLSKKFVVLKDGPTPGRSGQVGVKCYDENGEEITNPNMSLCLDAQSPDGIPNQTLSYSEEYGGSYLTSTPSPEDVPVYFSVRSNVKSVYVFIGAPQSYTTLSSFTIKCLDNVGRTTGLKQPGLSSDGLRRVNSNTVPTHGTYGVGEMTFAVNPSFGAPLVNLCSAAGTANTISAAGDWSGGRVLTNVTNIDNINIGDYITIQGFSSAFKIVTNINTTDNTITINSPTGGVAGTGLVIANKPPEWRSGVLLDSQESGLVPPEGVAEGVRSSIYHYAGTGPKEHPVYVKTTNGGNTGWKYLLTEDDRVSEASADTAGAPGGAYSQTEVQAILDELRDLKTKMRAAGLLAT